MRRTRMTTSTPRSRLHTLARTAASPTGTWRRWGTGRSSGPTPALPGGLALPRLLGLCDGLGGWLALRMHAQAPGLHLILAACSAHSWRQHCSPLQPSATRADTPALMHRRRRAAGAASSPRETWWCRRTWSLSWRSAPTTATGAVWNSTEPRTCCFSLLVSQLQRLSRMRSACVRCAACSLHAKLACLAAAYAAAGEAAGISPAIRG